MSFTKIRSSRKGSPVQRFQRALLPYLGSKRRLTPILFGLLAEVLPREPWSKSRLLDPLCGGNSIALFAEALGFSVTAADLAERTVVGARALVANNNVRLLARDLAWLVRDPPELYPWIAASFEPPLFDPGQARFVDRGLANAAERPEPIRSLLRQLLLKYILSCFPMSLPSASDARYAAVGDFERVSSRRQAHYRKRAGTPGREQLSTLAQAVNTGVFGGHGAWQKGDARAVLAATKAEVAVLDPPYPQTTTYDAAYSLVDQLLGDDLANAKPPSLDELLEAATEPEIVLVCYGGPSTSLEDVTELVGRHRPVLRAVEIPYPRLRAISREETNAESRELVVIAGR